MVMNSGDVNELRASEGRHAVVHAHEDRNLGRRTNATRPQATRFHATDKVIEFLAAL